MNNILEQEINLFMNGTKLVWMMSPTATDTLVSIAADHV